MEHVEQWLDTLTLDEKIRFLSGEGPFGTVSVLSKGIRGIRMEDGPSGIKTRDGSGTCVMSACLLAASWDKEICYEIGRSIGIEAGKLGIDMVLAPAVNIKRNPLAGRNFEYYSEDPFLTGTLASEYIKGIQSTQTLTCVKHFACNNQEHRRWSQNSVVDDDTMRNIYLKAFEIILTNTKADAVMASYNRINGTYACENKYLLTDILRKEWNFEGVVMSDWCAMNDCPNSFKSGLDLEMPDNAHNTVPKLKSAFENKLLTEAEIDEKVRRILSLSEKAMEKDIDTTVTIDVEKLIRMTGESFVLLKNEDVLPVDTNQSVLLIGTAKMPRIQGGGCAKMKTNVIKTPYEEIAKYADTCECIDGYNIEGLEEEFKKYDKIVVFLTLPEECDSESFDRKDISFPTEQTSILKKIKAYNENIVVVLQNGSAVDLSFEDDVKGIIEMYYAGSYGACALADVLYGKINPVGRLAETFPMSYSDVPSYDCFGLSTDVPYLEKEFVGYRYYSTYGVKTRYPFGFGLSYSKHHIKNIEFNRNGEYDFEISFDISNMSGCFDGKETVQIYLKALNPFEPKMQLMDFATIRIKAGATKSGKIHLERKHFEHYVGGKKVARTGAYEICVATSSEEILASQTFILGSEEQISIDKNTLLGMLLADHKYRDITLANIGRIINFWAYGRFETEHNFEDNIFLKSSVYNMPLRAFTYFAPKEFDDKKMDDFVAELRKI